VLAGSIAEAGTQLIGGLDQWVMIRGRDVRNPLLLVLHGGPGSSETAFFRAYNAALEDAFTVVYWDQRGAGRSYAKAIPPQSMTLEQFIQDTDALVDAVRERFGQEKVVILGHSWGSLLGTLYAARFPAKVVAYVGVGQVADMAASEAASYAFTLEEAKRRGHKAAITALEAMGPPPHDLKSLSRQRRWLMAFGGAYGPLQTMPRMVMKALGSPEASPWDLVRLVQGATFSTGLLWPTLMTIDLRRDCLRFDCPMIFILGRRDMQVVASVSADYFERLQAPTKALYWLERSGHFAPWEEPDAFNALMIDKVRPLAVGA
jgi:pimeloyl-ACP methyl ester carboxylesterase